MARKASKARKARVKKAPADVLREVVARAARKQKRKRKRKVAIESK